ncbi:MAG: helix-turn-helix domain-containing protein [candidate division Zixibacteria bacterium]|nr:helix-turn-helix domain-containing protein [candidate division Zixibacteria bacterium]
MGNITKAPIKFDVAKALQLRHSNGLTDSQIARQFGCTRQSVHRALKRFNKILLPASELQAYQEKKAGILESVEATLVCDLADSEKRKKASLNNTAYALSQVANMTRLEKGLSTSNVAYVDMASSLEEIQQQRRQLEEALKDL